MSTLLAALAAVAPGLYAWASGRRLVAALEDPAFPDLHFARSRAVGFATIAGIVVSIALAGGQVWWTMPLVLLALLTGVWPSRRVLFDETWPFARYLGFSLAAWIGMAGFWVLLVWAPILIAQLGRLHAGFAAAAGLSIAVLLIAINVNYARFWLAMHRGSPLSSPGLDERFDAILARAECTRPAVHRYGVPGGHIMNAFALPAAKSPAIAFGDSLLERMTPDEVAAIFAHEVAHLEHFTPARMRRIALATWTLVGLSTALPVAMVVAAPEYGILYTFVLLMAVVLVLTRITGRSQANETASDLRAAELTGDPETLIGALTKLHGHLRLPRHWPQEIEPSISHPSLARRIQAIRERAAGAGGTGGTGGAALPHTVVVRSTAAGVRIALDDARAYWFEGLPAPTPDAAGLPIGVVNTDVAELQAMREQASSQRAIAYSELSELRLVATAHGRALRARDLAGQAWTVTIHPDDVPILQRTLEVVDTRLGRRRRESSYAVARLLAAALLIALVAAGEIGIVLIPLAIAAFRPGMAAVAAMGAMAIVQAMATMVGGGLAGADALPLTGVAGMIVLGACALWLARRERRSADDEGRSPAANDATRTSRMSSRLALDSRTTATMTVVALGVTAGILALLVARTGAFSMPAKVFSEPLVLALAVTAVGAASTLVTLNGRRWRRLGIAAAIVAAAGALAAARNAAAAHGEPLQVVEVVAGRTNEIRLARVGYRIELSPGGRHWAVPGVVSDGAHYQNDRFRWMIGRVDAAADVREIDATDVAFLDDERLIALVWHEDSLEVRVEPVAIGDGAVWRRSLPALIAPALFPDIEGNRWTVAGRRDDGTLVAFAGSLDGGEVTEHAWARDSMWVQPFHFGAQGDALGYSTGVSVGALNAVIAIVGGTSFRADLWRFGADGHQRVGTVGGVPICRAAGGAAVCIGIVASRTRLWRVTTEGVVSPLATIPAGYDVRHAGRAPEMAAIARNGTGPLLIDVTTGRASRVRLHGGDDAARQRATLDAQANGGVLAILEMGVDGTRIGVYRIERSPVGMRRND